MALSRAKSAGGEGIDPDFAFHEDVLINDDRFRPVDTPTTRARAVEMNQQLGVSRKRLWHQHIGRRPFSDL